MEKERRVVVHSSQKDSLKGKDMDILSQSFGEYGTNCYICRFDEGEIVIDPGKDSYSWVVQSCQNPLAILNTHGHYDHIWDNAPLKKHFSNIPLICPELDSFMLESDCFGTGVTPSKADILVPCKKDEEFLDCGGIEVKFTHFPGHTPGCSVIEVGGEIFSGDFIFYRSIGRSDFPYSSVEDMRDSLLRFATIKRKKDIPIHPGHGRSTTLFEEQHNVKAWIRYLESELQIGQG